MQECVCLCMHVCLVVNLVEFTIVFYNLKIISVYVVYIHPAHLVLTTVSISGYYLMLNGTSFLYHRRYLTLVALTYPVLCFEGGGGNGFNIVLGH